MLSQDPVSQYIFQAAAIEDKIRAELIALKAAKGSAELIGRQENIVFVLMPQLHELNKNHFHDSAAITQTLKILNDAVERLDHTAAWDAFLNLAERPGDNFGTWAI